MPINTDAVQYMMRYRLGACERAMLGQSYIVTNNLLPNIASSSQLIPTVTLNTNEHTTKEKAQADKHQSIILT